MGPESCIRAGNVVLHDAVVGYGCIERGIAWDGLAITPTKFDRYDCCARRDAGESKSHELDLVGVRQDDFGTPAW